jgi:hypothetical protein
MIVCFTTSQDGWAGIRNGNLINKPSGDSTPKWHATLMEGYDLEAGYAICKNSWGDSAPRFDLQFAALHDFYCVQVYYTRKSVAGKQWKEIIPQIEKFKNVLEGRPVKCVWLDEAAGVYHLSIFASAFRRDAAH